MTETQNDKIKELFPHLPGEARVWIYCADRPLNNVESTAILETMQAFTGSWQSHGRKVTADASVLSARFVVIAGVIPNGDVSGCGIDASTRALNQIAQQLQFGFSPALNVVFRERGSQVESASRSAFRERVRRGEATEDLFVFDFSVTTLADVRAGRFEVPLSDSWFASDLPVNQA